MLQIPPQMEKDAHFPFRKLYHFHLPKCAGTAVNLWIDSLFPFERCRPADFRHFFPRTEAEIQFYESIRAVASEEGRFGPLTKFIKVPEKRALYAASMLYTWLNFDVFHGHRSVLWGRQPNTFVFTILRDPVSRVKSVFRDFARLVPSDYAHMTDLERSVRDAIRTEPIGTVIRRFGELEAFKKIFADQQARLLTQDFVAAASFMKMTVQERADAAISVIDHCMNFAGVQEDMDLSLRGLAYELRLPPPSPLPRRNVTAAGKEAVPETEADRWLADNNQADEIVYRHVLRKLENNAAAYRAYNDAEFEEKGAAIWLSNGSSEDHNAEHLLDMNMPMIGRGFLERDAAGSSRCARWTTGNGEATIYLPAEIDTPYRVKIYILGWMDWEESKELTVEIDGELTAYQRSKQSDDGECIILEIPARDQPWIKVVTHTPSSKTAVERGRVDDDPRSKSYLLWKVGLEKIVL